MLSIAIAVAAVSVLLGVHPFVTYPLSLLAMRRKPLAKRMQVKENVAFSPSVAICMSAYNEAKVIAAKMDSLLAMAADYPGEVSIHVYADAPSDGTESILAGYSDRADIVIGTERRGKTWGMNHLAARSKSEFLLFTDANVVSEMDVVSKLASAFADPEVGLASARLRYSNPDESATSRAGAAYWELEEAIKRLESETVGLIGVDGAMFMVRRSAYDAPPPHLIDDFYISLSVLASGLRVISVEDVEVYERSAVLAGEEYMRKRRIACQAWNVHRALWPRLRRMPAAKLYGYISHRILKWLTPYLMATFMLALLAVAIDRGGAVQTALVAGLLVAALALGTAIRLRPATIVTSVLYSLFGVALGPVESWLLGKTYIVWLPADSVRTN